MSTRKKQAPPALKHGAYATTVILPGEDKSAFDRLHKSLVSEFRPQGIFEEEVIGDLARLMWRKKNLGTYRLAELARERYLAIEQQKTWCLST